MLNVFVKKSAEELHMKKSEEELYVELSDGRMMPLENLARDYERLLKKKSSEKDDSQFASKPKPGKWFCIDREVINSKKEMIHRKCNEEGTEGKELWERFEESNEIADENPEEYPCLIETYIFEYEFKFISEGEMREMCAQVGDEMCDEVICDLELQMRICNGERVVDLVSNRDMLPRRRVIKLRNGNTAYFGGSTEDNIYAPPAVIINAECYRPNQTYTKLVAYAFHRVLS